MQLTAQDIRNTIAMINRAQISGAELETIGDLKHRYIGELKRLESPDVPQMPRDPIPKDFETAAVSRELNGGRPA